MADINNANEQLIDLIFKALDHGIDSVKDSGGPLITFLMTDSKGEKKLQRFVTERLEEGPPQAREFLKGLAAQPEFAAIAYDGYVTIENAKFDAVMVEGYDKNDNDTYVLAQRYKPKKFLSKFATIGNAAFLGSVEGEGETVDNNFRCFIMFNNDEIRLDTAAQKLRDARLSVERSNDKLRTAWDDGPELVISYSHGEKVLQGCKSLGSGTEYEAQLQNCSSRFEISFDNFDEVLDEINTLIEVQGTLQELTDGIIYNTWNQQLSKD